MKRTLALLLTVLVVFALAGCGTAPQATSAAPVATATAPAATATTEATASPQATATPAPTATPQAAPEAGLTDFLGTAVTLSKFPERIISLTPSNTEIVYALGLESKLVGVDAFSDYPEAAKALAKVGDFNGPNLETIVALKPDLVLAGNKLQKDVIDKIKALNINVVAAEATEYNDVAKSIELIGKLTGTEAKATDLVADMKAKEQIVLDAVAKATTGKTVYYAMSYGEMGNWTGGPGSFPFEFIQKCGSKNITEGMPVPWVNLSQEELVKKNPDIILLSSDVDNLDKFKKAEGYKDLKAVKAGKVFVVTSNLCSRPSPRLVEGLREFAQIITGVTIKFPGE
jgi:iron complex transport system substrate-binding protein